jgi:signal transduction histidine kinase/ligand-binding sensor domain-containing protein
MLQLWRCLDFDFTRNTFFRNLSVWFVFIFFCVVEPIPAQQDRFDAWTTENGLPINFLRAVVQTRDGYLWMTTGYGIVRFDGSQFRSFLSTDTPGISSDNYTVFALHEDRHGRLWAGTRTGGVVLFEGRRFRSFTVRDGLPSNEILRVDEDDAGGIWIYTSKGLVRYRDERLTDETTRMASVSSPSFSKPDGLNGADAPHVGLWRKDAQGWWRFAYGRWARFPLPPGVKKTVALVLTYMYEDTQRRVWYALQGYKGQYFCVENEQLRVYRGIPGEAIVCYRDREGWLWLSDHHGRVARWKDGQWRAVSEFSTPFIFMALEDQSGGLWIATFNAGLFHRRHLPISCLRRPGLAEVSSTLLRDAQDHIWIGSWGLKRFGAPGPSHARHDGSFWPAVTALYQDHDGTIYVGSLHGLAKFRAGRFVEDAQLASAIQGRVFAIQRDRAGQLWIGCDDGLYGFDGRRFLRYGQSEGLDGSSISAIHEDRAGLLWVGTYTGLFVRRGGQFAPFHDSAGKTIGQIVSLFEDSSGVLWVGTYGQGLCRIADCRCIRYTTEQGLATNMVYNLVEDDRGFLWFGSASGLVRTSKTSLNAYAAGTAHGIFSMLLGKTDGLVDLDVSSLGQPGAVKAADGKLWFATTSPFLAIVDPAALPADNSRPPIRIEDCQVDGRVRPCEPGLTIKSHDSEIQIRYSALGFYRPKQYRFKYKLEGLDREWTYAGTRRVAYFSRPPGGTFLFRVAVANGDGLWNPEQRTLQLTVQTPFYESWPFRTAVVFLVVVTIAGAWRHRMRNLQRAQAAQQAFSRQVIASQESERKRIATELHDSLGQRLIVIKNLALLSLQAIKEAGALHERITEISSQASDGNREVREIAYNLRPYQLDRLGLTKAIQSLATGIQDSSKITITMHLDNVDNVLPKNLEINFYRIVQEALNNMAKHSQASEATLLIERTADRVLLMIRDNGKGGIPHPPDRNISSGGFGLAGMIERGASLGGNTVIQSVPEQGTLVTLEIPLPSTKT